MLLSVHVYTKTSGLLILEHLFVPDFYGGAHMWSLKNICDNPSRAHVGRGDNVGGQLCTLKGVAMQKSAE